MKTLLAAALAVAFSSPAWAQTPAPQVTQDIVKLRANNTEVKCKVSKMTSTTVVYKDSNGKEVTAKNDDVLDVTLGDISNNMRQGNRASSENNNEKALNWYKEALNEIAAGKLRDLHKQYIYRNMALTQVAKKEPEAALETLRTLRKECGDCRLRGESYRHSLEIARKSGDAAVMDVLEEMKKEPGTAGGEADLELGKMKYAKNSYDEANQIFTRLSTGTEAYASEARLYSIRCLRAMKKIDELESICAQILANRATATMSLIQVAGATQGQALLKKADKDETKVREALLAFAQAIGVGAPATRDEAEDYVVALMGAAKCYQMMAKTAAKPEAKVEYIEKAKDYLREVVRGYPKTDWASTAQRELTGIEAEKSSP